MFADITVPAWLEIVDLGLGAVVMAVWLLKALR